MKIGTVLTACDLNPLYCDFIPMFIEAWKILFPEIDICIVLIADQIPEQLVEYLNHIKLFSPIEGIDNGFVAQCIRLLYPREIERDEGVLITDMDMIPLNRGYYESVRDISDDTFVNYRDLGDTIICYNVATPRIWRELMGERSIEENLREWYKGHVWTTDQAVLWKRHDSYTGKKITLSDRICGFNRLDRSGYRDHPRVYENIEKGLYSDYHCLRPYMQFRVINDKIIDHLRRITTG